MNQFHCIPSTESCSRVYQSKDHACIGISPYNSLFCESYIANLISWGLKNFRKIHLFFPDEPTLFTLKALGYDEVKARKKLKKQINWLRNKIHKGLSRNGIMEIDYPKYILDWKALSANVSYNNELKLVYSYFNEDHEFRESCLQASRWVLQNKVELETPSLEQLEQAVHYFLAELPLFAKTNEILGIESSTFCYHQKLPFHEEFYSKKFPYKPSSNQAYGILREN